MYLACQFGKTCLPFLEKKLNASCNQLYHIVMYVNSRSDLVRHASGRKVQKSFEVKSIEDRQLGNDRIPLQDS